MMRVRFGEIGAKPLLAILVWGAFGNSYGMDAKAEKCEQLWREESSTIQKIDVGSTELLQRWQMHRKECAGSIAYEARLATAYLVAKQPEKAREIIRPFVGRPSELSYLVDYAQLQIDYFEKGLFVQAT